MLKVSSALSLLTDEAAATTAPFLFGIQATKDGETVMELAAFAEPDGHVLVQALTWNTRTLAERPPVKFRHRFEKEDAAKAFADETVLCLEYLGCTINPLPTD